MMKHFLRCTILSACFLLAVVSPAAGQGAGLLLAADTVVGLPGAEVVVPVRVQGFTGIITGQGTISFDPRVVGLLGVEQFGLPYLGPANFGTTRADTGVVLFSWDDALLAGQSLADSAVLFALRFKVRGAAGTGSAIGFADRPTPLEFAGKEFLKRKLRVIAGKVQVAACPIFPVQVAGEVFCAGSPIPVTFATQGAYGADNVFTVQLSDATGSFGKATAIGSGSSSPLVAVLPAAAAAGTRYRIRVRASSPAVTGCDNGRDLTILGLPDVPAVMHGSSCGPGAVTLTASGGAAGSYRWYADAAGQALTGQVKATFTTPLLSASRTYYVATVNSLGCESQRVAVAAQVYALGGISAGPDTAVCITDAPFILAGAGPAGGRWFGHGVTESGLFDPGAAGRGTYTLKYTFTCPGGSVAEATRQIRVIDVQGKPRIRQTGGGRLVASIVGALYEWEVNGKAFTTATNRIRIREAGFYTVRVLDGNCASERSASFGASLQADFLVFPNPSRGAITLAGPALAEALEIEVFNSIGQRVYGQRLAGFTGNQQLDLHFLNPDLYLVVLSTAKQRKVLKLAMVD